MDKPLLKSSMTDIELMRRITEGDSQALELLFDRHAPQMYHFALQVVRDTTLAEELVTDLFLSAWRSTTRRREVHESAGDWLLAMAVSDPEFKVHWDRFSPLKQYWIIHTVLDTRDSTRSATELPLQAGELEWERIQSAKEALFNQAVDTAMQSWPTGQHQSEPEEAEEPTTQQMAVELQQTLGPRLAALTVGASNAQEIVNWATGKTLPDPQMAQTIRRAYSIVELLLRVESLQAIRAWFLGMNPELGDQAPALVLQIDPELVAQAAQNFVATG